MPDVDDRRVDDKRWHLDKKLNIGHMLTTMLIVGSGFMMLNDLQDKIVITSSKLAHQRELIDRVERLALARSIETRQQLDKIDGKLDRLLDRELERNAR